MAVTITRYPIGGGNFRTVYTGDSNANNVTGTNGSDEFRGRGGNDRFDGRNGLDIAVFNKPIGSYDLRWVGDSLIVTDRTGEEGSDTLINVEQLNFAGTLYNVADFDANEAPSAPADANGAANSIQEGAANGTAVGITASS
ncbi:MAG: hypothetical protein QOF78_1276, partial [Phycisphaerales bacterium]|nr:hypothetical protein [Phycisphaerales bacterium]